MFQTDNRLKATIRAARVEDAEPIAGLCEQLGYPACREEVERRLRLIREDRDHALLVAECAEGCVVGWLHVYLCKLVESDPAAEIGGLVVDEGARRCGVGRLLMLHAEQWARQKGCAVLTLRSNIVRKHARAFYERIGYSTVKTQFAFRKFL